MLLETARSPENPAFECRTRIRLQPRDFVVFLPPGV